MTIKKIYKNNYPKDVLSTERRLNKMGLKGSKQVSKLIVKETFEHPLYEIKKAKKIDIANADVKELESWLKGIKSDECTYLEYEKKEHVIKEISIRLKELRKKAKEVEAKGVKEEQDEFDKFLKEISVEVYSETYPEEYKTEAELARMGVFKTHRDAILMSEGKESDLFKVENVQRLTIEGANEKQLYYWRNGLKENKELFSLEAKQKEELLRKIESLVKENVLKANKDKEWVTSDTLFFEDEVPKDKMCRRRDLQKQYKRGTVKVGAYIAGGTRCYSLYEVKSSTSLTIENMRKGEANIISLELIKEIEELEQTLNGKRELLKKICDKFDITNKVADVKRSCRKSEISKIQSVKMTPEKLIQDSKENPESIILLDIETTGIGFEDEIIKLSIMDINGNEIYQNYFNPVSDVSPTYFKKHLLDKEILKDKSLWENEVEKIEKLIANKKVVVKDIRLVSRMIQQTSMAHGVVMDDSYSLICFKETFDRDIEVELLNDSYVNTLKRSTLMLSAVNEEADIFVKQKKACDIFECYCEKYNKGNKEEISIAIWNRLSSKFDGVNAENIDFNTLTVKICDFVIEKLSR